MIFFKIIDGFIITASTLTKLNITLSPAVMEGEEVVKEAVVIGIGTLITTIIDFILVALVVFLVVKGFNKVRALAEKKKEEEPAPEEPAGPTTEELLGEILEELKKQGK